jgi:hypothetical protein
MDRNSTNDEIGKQIPLPLQFHPTSLLKLFNLCQFNIVDKEIMTSLSDDSMN